MAKFYKKFQEKLFADFVFEELALEAFHHQSRRNPVYREYLQYLKKQPKQVTQISQIPFLPIEFFKTQRVLCEGIEPEVVFRSSGTTATSTSQHFIQDLSFYHRLSTHLFELEYGAIENWNILALLPSYLERSDASLVYMIDNFIKHSGNHSGFYLYNQEDLVEKLSELTKSKQQTMLIGVTFALMDLLEKYDLDLSGCILTETGGMKGRRKEIIRSELHDIFQKKFKANEVHSEYGMTELLSQSYSCGNGSFKVSKTMKVLLREMNDPMEKVNEIGRTGGVNVIDLANIHSCCFVETKDIGRFVSKHEFEILGRFDNSEIRGCNLMIE
ncbi:MAG: hypothetical protein ACJAWV_000104 [Flammeovirgaceae bacterium]|jgi:hypothetical protein